VLPSVYTGGSLDEKVEPPVIGILTGPTIIATAVALFISVLSRLLFSNWDRKK
jgi:hypothetical protein